MDGRPSPEQQLSVDQPSDAELLRQHADGDPEAFGQLFQRHSARLWAVALRTVGDPEEAADALQEAMISAFRRAGDFRGRSAVTTWLHRIVVNASVDRLRRRSGRNVNWSGDEEALQTLTGRSGGLAASSITGAVPGSPAGPDAPDSVELRLEVDKALRLLPPQQRAVLVLVDMLGYPVAEVAEILGISAGTVKSRCARGRAKLLPRLEHLRSPESDAPDTLSSGLSPGTGNRPAAPNVSSEQEGGV